MDPVETARALVPVARSGRTPILASWLWGAANPASLAALQQAEIPTFSCPNAAVRAFDRLSHHGGEFHCLSGEPGLAGCDDEPLSVAEWEPIRKPR